MDKIQELCEGHCTVMLVSHGLQVVKQLADRCLWLERGLVRWEAPAADVVEAYLADTNEAADAVAMEDV
jgi:ABC-type polysaccharide/polyol phosphate transport system ATPase subunit